MSSSIQEQTKTRDLQKKIEAALKQAGKEARSGQRKYDSGRFQPR